MNEIDSLNSMFQMHIKECDSRDTRNTKAIEEIKEMFKGIWDAHDEMRRVVTSLQIKAALAVGGLVVLSKVADYLIEAMK